jgi:hypothetical protein
MINTTRDFWKMCQIALASAAFWPIFQKSLVVLIINCTPSRVITYTYSIRFSISVLYSVGSGDEWVLRN